MKKIPNPNCEKCHGEGLISTCLYGNEYCTCDETYSKRCDCTKGWKLWLDDQVDDPETPARHAPEGWAPIGTSADAISAVIMFGLPTHIDFDHDLGVLPNGENDTAMIFLRWLEHSPWIDGDVPEYRIHSANPVGSKNIISFMESWKKSKTL